ncbi:MAG: type I DNA topoisomerase [Myxococcota bacterium]
MSRSLVIVESPAKASTIQKFLGDDYVVESSVGHIRDLARPTELSKELKKKSKYIQKFAVDVENDFEPIYVVSGDKKQQITKLKRELKASDELLLATDEDREGESIAWHLLEVLKPRVPVKRMVFHEITKGAIQKAVSNPRELDKDLVDAQEARRILDRLYGFAMSGVVQRRGRAKSAGRVQSVATRIIVERERYRIAFRRASYWDLEAALRTEAGAELTATLVDIDGSRVATGRDFGDDGKLTKEGLVALGEADAKSLEAALKGAPFRVASVERKNFKRSPAAPFMTSTLQQEAGRKLRFGSKRTMAAAQRLYENGHITYMRTDSTTLSDTALKATRTLIAERFTSADLPDKPRLYKRKVKNAQEAHEAVRPAGDTFQDPKAVARHYGGPRADEARLYELIWKRTVASQMADARGESLVVRIEAKAMDGRVATFTVRGQTITFPGFIKAYVEGSDDPQAELESRDKLLPPLQAEQLLESLGCTPRGHETQPPARFTEASLVKRLEELGVGRPSTYASILGVIQDRGYVWKKGQALVPSFKAFQVVRLLEEHFGHLVDYTFTARMEDDLDGIASGSEKRGRWLRRFFLGDGGAEGLEQLVEGKLESIDLDEVKRLETFPIGTTEEGKSIVARVGQYGPYVTIEGEDVTASVPEDLPPDELTLEKAVELLQAPSGDRVLGQDPATGLDVIAKAGRYGPFVQLGEAKKGSKEKPKTASLFKSMAPDTVSLEEALRLLSLPRTVGTAPDGETIEARNGRYGPFIAKGKDNRSLETEEQIFSVTVEQALALLAQPKRRGRAAAKPPLKELGDDGVSGKPIVLKEGRYGLYVTDGETNASLRTGDTQENITPERAQELLALRRLKQGTKKPAKKKTAKKKTTKKAAKKTAKKAAKKTAKRTTKKAAKKAQPSSPAE